MAPTRHTRSSANAAASTSLSKDDSLTQSPQTGSSSVGTSALRTPNRPSPYTRTPSKQVATRSTGPSTPASKTSSPMMIREIFQIISPFRTYSRASRSAAFGGGSDEVQEDEEQTESQTAQLQEEPRTPEPLDDLQSHADVDEQEQHTMEIEEATEAAAPGTTEPLRPLPLSDDALVTPGIHKYGRFDQMSTFSQAGPSASTPRAAANTSPVSRNYDLLARFFAEKQRGGGGLLNEVEYQGCLQLIAESMAAGRDLESEFGHVQTMPSTRPRHAPSDLGSYSRASSVVPAFPASQTMDSLFHPGSYRLTTSSSAYSFLAPRPSAPTSASLASVSTTRRRPIYVGPGMSGLSLNRRRTLAPSARTAGSLLQGRMPSSATDPNLARHVDAQEGQEEAKRRRTAMHANEPSGSAATIADTTAEFESSFERQRQESSALAKELAKRPTSAPQTTSSPRKRAVPTTMSEEKSASSVEQGVRRAPTRTAAAVLDILKDSPPIREPMKPELVNPYQNVSGLNGINKKTTNDGTASPKPAMSARASMLTRAKAKEAEHLKATKAEKSSPPKESVLDLIARTAPKPKAGRKRTADDDDDAGPEKKASEQASSVGTPVKAAQREQEQQQQQQQSSAEARKLQKTEEVQRRLDALTKMKSQPQASQQQQQQQPAAEPANQPTNSSTFTAPKPAAANSATSATPTSQKTALPASVSASSLFPSQYTASKPKKPSPLSVAFQAPESPVSESETSQSDIRTQKPAPVPFTFGSPVSTSAAPSSGFSFSASKPGRPGSSNGTTAATTPTSGFTFTPLSTAPSSGAPQLAKATSPSFASSSQSSAAQASKSSSTSTDAAPRLPLVSQAIASLPAEVKALPESSLPAFDFPSTIPSRSASQADRALQDEIRSVADSALPNYEFVFQIKTETDDVQQNGKLDVLGTSRESAIPNSSSPFSAGSPRPSEPRSSPATAVSSDAASNDHGASPDPSQPQSSGLLGEGEGEESETTQAEARAKFWKFDSASKAWKDLGVCIAKIKLNKDTNKTRLLARNEANGKVMVNFLLYKSLTVQREKAVNSFLGFEGSQATQFRMKTKLEDQAQNFKEALENAVRG